MHILKSGDEMSERARERERGREREVKVPLLPLPLAGPVLVFQIF